MLPSSQWYKGQYKRPGIPRINWAHPLARGLQFYVYDAGGFLVDLVTGSLGYVFTSPNNLKSKTYALGNGVFYPGTTTDACIGITHYSQRYNSVGPTVPYSTAIGTYYTVTPPLTTFVANTIDMTQDGGTNTAFLTSGTGANKMQYVFDNGIFDPDFATAITHNIFQTWIFSADTSTTATMYANGKQDTRLTGVVTQFAVSHPAGPVINGGFTTSQLLPGGVSGFLPFFAGWYPRFLSANDAFTLQNDPYCFLIYPEDEVRSFLVGSTGGPAVPYNPWPQLGPLVAQRIWGWLPSIPRRPLWTPQRAALAMVN